MYLSCTSTEYGQVLLYIGCHTALCSTTSSWAIPTAVLASVSGRHHQPQADELVLLLVLMRMPCGSSGWLRLFGDFRHAIDVKIQ